MGLLPRIVAAALLLLAAATQARAQVTTAADLAAKLYGVSGQAAFLPSNPTVGTSPVNVAKNAPSRFELLVINLSANTCYAAPASNVSTTNGIILAPSGGTLNTEVKDDLILPASEWWIVCSGAASQLYVLESYLAP